MGKADTVLTLSQPLEVWGQRGARVRAARAEAQAAALRGSQSRSDVASQLAAVYAQAESALRRYTLAKEALSLTRDDANAVNAMVKQGREPQLRAVQAQSEVANAMASLDEAQAFRDAALARLAGTALLDAPVQSIDNSLLDRAPPLPRGATDTALAVRIAEAEADAASKLVDVERALPDLSVTAASAKAASVPTTSGSASASRCSTVTAVASAPPMPTSARPPGPAAPRQRGRTPVRRGRAEATGSRTRAADESVVAAEEAYRLARIGFDAGRISQLELRSTRSPHRRPRRRRGCAPVARRRGNRSCPP